MKKRFLLLAGSALILASCGSDTNTENNQQAQMDSIAKANAELQETINKAKNDSTINALAAAKADSIEAAKAAASGSKTTKSKTTTTTTTTTKETPPPPPPPPPKPGGMKGHSDQQQQQQQTQPQKGGMKAHSDQNQGK